MSVACSCGLLIWERTWRRLSQNVVHQSLQFASNCTPTGEALVRGALLRLPDLDAHLAAAIAGRSPGATELAVHLLKAAVQDANPPLAGADLPASVDVSIFHLPGSRPSTNLFHRRFVAPSWRCTC